MKDKMKGTMKNLDAVFAAHQRKLKKMKKYDIVKMR